MSVTMREYKHSRGDVLRSSLNSVFSQAFPKRKKLGIDNTKLRSQKSSLGQIDGSFIFKYIYNMYFVK